jgi:hypothetical protein
MTNFKQGDKVLLYPSDKYKKTAKILHVGDHGWEFEMLSVQDPEPDVKVGEIVFISYSNTLRMIKISR